MSSKAYLTWALNQEGDLVHVDEVPKPFAYYKKLSLEEICKKLHERLHKTYTGNYQDFYKDKDGNSFNTLL